MEAVSLSETLLHSVTTQKTINEVTLSVTTAMFSDRPVSSGSKTGVSRFNMIRHSFTTHLLDGEASIMLLKKILAEDGWFTHLLCCTLVPLHHHHHMSVMELEHLLTRSGLTYLEVSSEVCHDSFCQLGNKSILS